MAVISSFRTKRILSFASVVFYLSLFADGWQPQKRSVVRPVRLNSQPEAVPTSAQDEILEEESSSDQLLRAQKALVAIDEQNKELRSAVSRLIEFSYPFSSQDAFSLMDFQVNTYRRQMSLFQGQLTDSVMKRQIMKNEMVKMQEFCQEVNQTNAELKMELAQIKFLRERELVRARRQVNSLRFLTKTFVQEVGERIRKRYRTVRARIRFMFKKRR